MSVAISSNFFSWRYELADSTPPATAVAAVEIAPCADSTPPATAVAAVEMAPCADSHPVEMAPCADSTPPATAVAAYLAIPPLRQPWRWALVWRSGRLTGARRRCVPLPTTVGAAHFVAILFKMPLHLLLGLLTGIAVFLLDHADQFVLLAPDPVEVVISEFPPPGFQFAPHLFPLACKDVLIHRIVLHGLVPL